MGSLQKMRNTLRKVHALWRNICPIFSLLATPLLNDVNSKAYSSVDDDDDDDDAQICKARPK